LSVPWAMAPNGGNPTPMAIAIPLLFKKPLREDPKLGFLMVNHLS
jgi:hypothetical protein